MAKPKKKKNTRIARDNDTRLEILGIGIMALALLIMLALVSYHPTDYSDGVNAEVKNWLGPAGAVISNYLYVHLSLIHI